MTNPTRLIPEASVIALVQGKIDIAEDLIERLQGRDLKAAASLLDRISVLRTVLTGLTYISGVEPNPTADEYADDPYTPPQRFTVQEDEDGQWRVIDTTTYFTVSVFTDPDLAQASADHRNVRA